jgi:peptide/nickel transport system substrate-binding protein
MTLIRKGGFGLLSAFAASGLLAPSALADELRIVMEQRLGNLDPIMSAAHQTRDHGYLVYDTLYALDSEQQIQPQMIESHEVSEDGATYTFTLRDGLTWHDGTPVTSADVIASIDRWGQRDRMGLALRGITETIEAVDEQTFTVTLSVPTSVILDAFAKPSGVPLFIMPERVAQTPFSEQITEYIGSGPFVFAADQYEPGVRAVYTRFEDYVPRDEPASQLAGGKVAKVDRIERIEMADALTALNALNGGEVDYVQTVLPDLMPLLSPDVTTQNIDEFGYQIGYRFNHLQAPFDDRLVRQAAIWAIGQQEPLQAQFGSDEHYALCGAIFGCGLPYDSDAMVEMSLEADPDRARELLEEAGYQGEPIVLLHVTDSPAMSSIAPVLAQQLREAGFTVDLRAMDFMTMLSQRANQGPVSDGGWSIFITSWHNTEIQDPLRNYMIVAAGAGEEGYAGWADVPQIVEQTQAFLTAPSDEDRARIAAEIQSIVYEEAIYAPLGTQARLTALAPGVEGALNAPANVFWNISKGE